MPHRKFADARGVTWDVWDVEPSRAERRSGSERRRVPRGPDRRQQPSLEPRVRISGKYVAGWLAFQSRDEKRRLIPVPDGWDALTEAELERLLQSAACVGRPRRLLE
jgi:hypothetical protein